MFLTVLDLSNLQGPNVNFALLKANGVAKVILKCVEGTSYKDNCFYANWMRAQDAGLLVGAYGFSRPDLGLRAEDEAYWLLENLPPLQTGQSVWQDLEVGNGDLTDYALAYADYITRHIGFFSGDYSYPWFIANHLQGAALANLNLWLASYQPLYDNKGNVQWPLCPSPWREYVLWQQSSNARYPSIPDVVDLSVIQRDLAGLMALGKPAPIATPPVVVPPVTVPPVTPPVTQTPITPPPGMVNHYAIKGCALKPAPDHGSRALVMLAPGARIQVSDQTKIANGEKWSFVGYGAHGTYYTGYLLTANIR